MQAAPIFAPTLIPLTPSKNFSQLTIFPGKLRGSFASKTPIKAHAVTTDDPTVDYSSAFSVFPAEACETIGGEACWADMLPEAKLQPQAHKGVSRTTTENVDREYLEYTEEKTVFRRDACDELGGEFCEHDYQKKVY
ncbi:hypothetical protein UlMin_013901 [Ulmus minor]